MSEGRRRISAGWLSFPAGAWWCVFLLAPLGIVLVHSFAQRGTYGSVEFGFHLQNYARAFEPMFIGVFLASVRLAALTALSCAIAGFPVAYTIARARPSWRTPLLVALMVPFWTNFVVRTYALKVLLSEHGAVNWAAVSLGLLAEPFDFANSAFAIWLGMLINYLPFMVLPLYVALEKFDFTLMEAARDLGAGPVRAFFRVLLPGVRPGLVSGLIFVLTPALGEFVIPDMLGGARTLLIGNVITDQFLKSRDWAFGSALSLLLIAVIGFNLALLLRKGRAS